MNFQIFLRTVLALGLVFVVVFLISTGKPASNIPKMSNGRLSSTQLIDKAQILISDGKYDEAKQNLMTVLQFEPRNVYGNELLATVLSKSSETRKDLQKTLIVARNRPDYKAAWEKLASLYEVTGDLENARIARETAEGLEVI